MLKLIACSSVLAVTFLVAPTASLFAQSVATPSAVTGGDPQPTGQAMPVTILTLLPSLVVL